MSTVAIPEGFDLEATVKEGVKEAFADAACLRALKEKPFLTPFEVQRLYGFSPRTLKAWRGKKKGPRFVQYEKGDSVRYTHEAIKDYVSGRNSGREME